MDRKEFERLLTTRTLVMDGAMGTELIRLGCSVDHCLELMNRERPELVQRVHSQYVEAGADIICTNTFGANPFRLGRYGLAGQVRDLVQRGAHLAKQAVRGQALVALSVGPSGLRLGVDDDINFGLLVEGFREQIEAGFTAGVDLISIETMMDIQELKAVVVAARQVCDLPILAQLTFDGQMQTLSGTPATTASAVLSGLDIDLIGANCSDGPEQLLAVMENMRRGSSLPLIVQPNAGLPKRDGAGELLYPITPTRLADAVHRFIALGVRVVGSCCGSTPDHTRAIAGAVRSITDLPPVPNCSDGFLASQIGHLKISHQAPPVLIGERFSALYRTDLRQALIKGDRLPIMDEVVEQRSAGAQGINVSVSAPGLEECHAMVLAVAAVQQTVSLPLSIQTSDPTAMEMALQMATGRPLLNAVSATDEAIAQFLPLARRYGAMVIGLPQCEQEIDQDPQHVLAAARRIMERALRIGLRPQDLVIDCLGASASRGRIDLELTLKASELIHGELGLYTLFGVSGVSLGRKQRAALNAAYSTMAIHAGADILIANPLQREVLSSILASSELMGRRD